MTIDIVTPERPPGFKVGDHVQCKDRGNPVMTVEHLPGILPRGRMTCRMEKALVECHPDDLELAMTAEQRRERDVLAVLASPAGRAAIAEVVKAELATLAPVVVNHLKARAASGKFSAPVAPADPDADPVSAKAVEAIVAALTEPKVGDYVRWEAGDRWAEGALTGIAGQMFTIAVERCSATPWTSSGAAPPKPGVQYTFYAFGATGIRVLRTAAETSAVIAPPAAASPICCGRPMQPDGAGGWRCVQPGMSSPTADPFTSLTPGLYRLHWLAGGFSLAAVGRRQDGTRWFAPCDWATGQVSSEWHLVSSAEPIQT